jgi:hypothetical protein
MVTIWLCVYQLMKAGGEACLGKVFTLNVQGWSAFPLYTVLQGVYIEQPLLKMKYNDDLSVTPLQFSLVNMIDAALDDVHFVL